jgi:copper chaperone CopZ
METIELRIEGMSCGGCVASVEKALARVPGVARTAVSLDTKTAIVEGERLDRALVVRAVEDAGYDVHA